MARNTGRGSRIAAASPAAGMFVEAKRQGGSFQTLPRRSWRRDLWRALTRSTPAFRP